MKDLYSRRFSIITEFFLIEARVDRLVIEAGIEDR
jgi:hypothetical protein